MKTTFLVSGVLLAASIVVHAATNDLTSALQRGLFEEEANHNLDSAIQAYQSVATQFDKDRKLAATAIFRLGECYRKQGNTNAATAQYERILREFADQPTLLSLSRQNLAALGAATAAPAGSALSAAARQEQRRLLEQEIKLVEQKLATQQKQVDSGVISSTELFTTQREILELKRQLAALDMGQAAQGVATEPATTKNLTSTEAEEVKRIQALIKDSPDLINAKDAQTGATPLHKAASAGQLVVAQFLLANGADVEAQEKAWGGRTPLHYAASAGHKAMVELLLGRKANVQAADDRGNTPLHVAAQNGYRSIVELLLAHGAEVNAKTTQGTTPLLLAVTYGFRSVADLLLAHGADVNATTSNIHNGRENLRGTSLCIAARLGDPAMVELLLAKGAKVDADDGEGRTPLSYAAERRSSALVKRLLEAHADPNAGRLDLPLARAAHLGDLASLKLLLTNGADPNASSKVSWIIRTRGSNYSGGTFTPLFLAVASREAGAVTELIRFKADPNSVGPGDDPVIFDGLSDLPTLKALLAGGADPNRRGKHGNQGDLPPLFDAIWGKNPAAVELLLAYHADTGAKNKDGWTPLHAAAESGEKAILEFLLKNGADVNARSNAGATPLHVAVANRQREAIELLLASKADPNARNSEGLTPLDLAKNQERPPGPYGAYGPIPPQPPSAMPTPSRSLRLPGFPQALTSAEKPAEPVSSLLRQHGAVDDLPDFSALRVMRKGSISPWVVHKRDTNSWNRFTLLETVGAAYNGGGGLYFPDFARLKILRPDGSKPGASKEIPVHLMTSSNTFDCAKDIWLQFGDVLELPEREHTLGESQVRLSSKQEGSLYQCVKRQVKFVVKGQPTEVTLNGCSMATYLSQALKESAVQKILRSSSDFSRIRVTRTDPQTGRAKEILVNEQWGWSPLPNSDYRELLNNDLWLRDGDVIEVPDKPD